MTYATGKADDMEHLDARFAAAVHDELASARRKFPSSTLCFAALVEEVGELANAMLELNFSLKKYWENLVSKGEISNLKLNIWEEAVQVAVMAQRVAVEGDPSFGEETK